MAFVSLKKAENLMLSFLNVRTVNLLVPVILFVASFGVYLGRFQRWNSWDVLHNPFALGIDIINRFVSPVDHLKTWAITFIFSMLYTLLYFLVKIIPQVMGENKTAGE